MEQHGLVDLSDQVVVMGLDDGLIIGPERCFQIERIVSHREH